MAYLEEMNNNFDLAKLNFEEALNFLRNFDMEDIDYRDFIRKEYDSFLKVFIII